MSQTSRIAHEIGPDDGSVHADHIAARGGTAASRAVAAASAVELLLLCLWLGGSVVVGSIVAPAAFHIARAAPALAGNPAAQTAIAAGIVGAGLRAVNGIGYVAGVVIAASVVLRRRSRAQAPAAPRGDGPRFALLLALPVAAWLIALALGLGFFPALDSAQQTGATRAFDLLHKLYVALAGVQMLLLVGYIAVRSRSESLAL